MLQRKWKPIVLLAIGLSLMFSICTFNEGRLAIAEEPKEIIDSATAVFEIPEKRESIFVEALQPVMQEEAIESISVEEIADTAREMADVQTGASIGEITAEGSENSNSQILDSLEITLESVVTDQASASTRIEAAETGKNEAIDVLATQATGMTEKVDYSTENSTRGFVYRLYKTVLDREPDAAGLAYWVNQLDNGNYTAAGAVEEFFSSKEYLSSGKSNDEILTDCYNTLLNREPDSTGYDYWIQRLDVGMTSQSVLYGFVTSKEFTELAAKYGLERGEIELTNPLDLNYDRTYFVYRMYKNCLGREPDKAGETYWCNNLANGMTGVQVASGFFFSDEFNNYRYDNPEFVALLYQTILGRQYDLGGLIDWTDKLNYSDTREKVLNGFITSAEFAEQCEKAQINAGEPMITPDDTITWQNNISVLQLCNHYRRVAGLYDLYTREDLLWDLAMLRAEEITEQFAHTRPDGTSCFSLFTEQGFYGYLGENLAGGQTTAAEVVEAWMNSTTHRANIMSNNYTYLATGYLYDPGATTYCAEGKYAGQNVSFLQYWAQSFCNYGVNINK